MPSELASLSPMEFQFNLMVAEIGATEENKSQKRAQDRSKGRRM